MAGAADWAAGSTPPPSPPTDKLVSEAQTILSTVNLTDTEKAQLQVRIDAGFSREVIGG